MSTRTKVKRGRPTPEPDVGLQMGARVTQTPMLAAASAQDSSKAVAWTPLQRLATPQEIADPIVNPGTVLHHCDRCQWASSFANTAMT